MTDITKQLADMQNEIKHISHELVRLSATTEQQLADRRYNFAKLEKLHTEFSHLKGGLSFIKTVVGILSASIIAFCTWIVTSGSEQDQQIIKLYSQVALLDSRVTNLESEIAEGKYDKIK